MRMYLGIPLRDEAPMRPAMVASVAHQFARSSGQVVVRNATDRHVIVSVTIEEHALVFELQALERE